MTTMDATILTVLGTGLTAIGTGVALFVALWRVQGNRFDAVDRRFDMAEKLNRERFDMAEKLNRERFEAMDQRWTERFEMAENANRERFEAMDRRFDMAEKRNQAAHAAICDAIGKIDRRLDDLYRHLLGAPAKTDLSGPAPAAG
jgi:peroxiredoxin family protein